MRPTPAETIDGIVRILRDTVAPAVTDPHARTQLHQIMVVLAQMQVDDPAAAIARADDALRLLLAACQRWLGDDTARASAFRPITPQVPTDPGIAEQHRAHDHNRAVLEAFVIDLRGWREEHGPTDSDHIFDAIGHHFQEGTT